MDLSTGCDINFKIPNFDDTADELPFVLNAHMALAKCRRVRRTFEPTHPLGRTKVEVGRSLDRVCHGEQQECCFAC